MPSSRLFKIGTLNIQKRNRSPAKAERIEAAIAAQAWDVLFFQECLLGHDEKILGLEKLRAEFPFEATSTSRIFKNGIWMGNAILSKHPLHHVKSLKFRHARGMSQRSALAARLELGGKRCLLVSLHLGLLEGERNKQISQILAYCHDNAKDFDGLVLAGDFNDWSGRCHRDLSLWSHDVKQWKALSAPDDISLQAQPLTYPAAFPILALDRIYAWGACSIERRLALGGPMISDHRAVVADLRLR
ncbi:MAG: endonuclease/exonuclease/phosphatase family protein [Bdellovibrionota bacterium]